MTYREFVSWIAYRNRWGTLHHGLRIDRAIGRSSAFFGNLMARSATLSPDDFSVHDNVMAVEGGPEDVHKLLTSIARCNNGN